MFVALSVAFAFLAEKSMDSVMFYPQSKLFTWHGLLLSCHHLTENMCLGVVNFKVQKHARGTLELCICHERPFGNIRRYMSAKGVGIAPIRRIQRWGRLMLERLKKRLAFAMGLHNRLGAKSLVFALDKELLQLIGQKLNRN